MTWQEYFHLVESLLQGLLSYGIQAGDPVAIFSNTRFEWAAADIAVLGLGGITIPIYQSHTGDELKHTINHSSAKLLIVENPSMLKKWLQIQSTSPTVTTVVLIDGDLKSIDSLPSSVQFKTWDQWLQDGRKHKELNRVDGAELMQKVTLDQIATIVYTSGTSGQPKGVVLTHRQIIAEVEDLMNRLPISPLDSTLSFLPYAHVLGRVEHWLHVRLGFTLNFAESIERLQSNLKEVKPTVIIGVPRIFEKIYASLVTQVEGHYWRKKIFEWSQNGSSFFGKWTAELTLNRLLREGLGGQLRFFVSGGAPLEPKLGAFFKGVGLTILEGYGLTETTAAIAVGTPNDNRIGTVGKPLPSIEIKIADDGEILVRGPQVMREYYKDLEATQEVIKDGYFATGDIGEFTSDGYLRITDRKKDLIKTSGGKYVAPQKLEGLLKLNPLVSNVLVHGDKRKYIVALVTLNSEYLKKLAHDRKMQFSDYRGLTQTKEVRQMLQNHIKSTNAQLASFESIKNFAILDHDFSIESGELTPSLKVRRKVCDERYKDTIDSLY